MIVDRNRLKSEITWYHSDGFCFGKRLCGIDWRITFKQTGIVYEDVGSPAPLGKILLRVAPSGCIEDHVMFIQMYFRAEVNCGHRRLRYDAWFILVYLKKIWEDSHELASAWKPFPHSILKTIWLCWSSYWQWLLIVHFLMIKWWFSRVLLVYQRVNPMKSH